MKTWFAKASHQRRWLLVVGACLALGMLWKLQLAGVPHSAPGQVGVNGTNQPASFAATAWCTNRLAQIDEAITLWATTNHKGWLDRPTAEDLAPYFPSHQIAPCEEGGTYQFGTSRLATVCSRHGIAQTPAPPPPPPTPPLQALYNSVESFVRDVTNTETRAAKNACVANLKQIDGAIQQWALENNKRSTDNVANEQIIGGYLKGNEFPTCPQGGKYHVGTVSQNPTCTICGHEL